MSNVVNIRSVFYNKHYKFLLCRTNPFFFDACFFVFPVFTDIVHFLYLYVMSGYLPQGGRRKFFRVLGGVLAAPFLVIAGMAVKKAEQHQGKCRIILPAVPEGISFHGAVITIREGKNVRVLSSSCTHLGCRIRSTRDGHLQCPCHGSEFSGDGSVLKGPADRPLTPLNYKTDPATGQLTVYLNREA